MKKFMILLSLTLFSVTSFAESINCELHLVQDYEGASNEIIPKIENIMLDKGYRIINDGLLYETTHTTNLKVREDLLVPGTLIGIDYTNFNILPRGQSCEDWSISKKGLINCSFRFSLYVINKEGKSTKLTDIEESRRVQSNFLNKKEKIIKKFQQTILDRAIKEIPECKY